jgi:hypothetical protein
MYRAGLEKRPPRTIRPAEHQLNARCTLPLTGHPYNARVGSENVQSIHAIDDRT